MRFALLGHPVAHSISPEIHAAAYAAMGVEHEYVSIDVPDQDALLRATDAVRRGELAGVNVTVPHKQSALRLADNASDLAVQTSAANVLNLEYGKLVAHNTDVLALQSELAAHGDGDCLVLGSGGAALAAVSAARQLGMKEVHYSCRRFQGDKTEWPTFPAFEALHARPIAWSTEAMAARLASTSVILQATSAGMHGAASGDAVAELVPWSVAPAAAIAYDVVYNPTWTPFLEAARSAGLKTKGGLGMLARQAAHAIEIWLGDTPPLAALEAAAKAAMKQREAALG